MSVGGKSAREAKCPAQLGSRKAWATFFCSSLSTLSHTCANVDSGQGDAIAQSDTLVWWWKTMTDSTDCCCLLVETTVKDECSFSILCHLWLVGAFSVVGVVCWCVCFLLCLHYHHGKGMLEWKYFVLILSQVWSLQPWWIKAKELVHTKKVHITVFQAYR